MKVHVRMQVIFFRILHLVVRTLRLSARELDQWISVRWDRVAPRPAQNEAIQKTMTLYDMVARPDEPYYARQYLRYILSELDLRFPGRCVRVLDLGCGQGRLTLPLAEWCAIGEGRVLGIDLTPAAVKQARNYAAARGLSNVSFQAGDIAETIRMETSASVDVMLLTEVTYVLPVYREVLREMERVLRPGGLMFLAFRSQYYNLLSAVRDRLWDGADMAVKSREGGIFGGTILFNWQTTEDIRSLLNDLGLQLLNLRGIGVCSGIEGDPLAEIARPSLLSTAEQERLMAVECAIAEEYASCGRYILATAIKSQLPQEVE